jgi:hypothetical protein
LSQKKHLQTQNTNERPKKKIKPQKEKGFHDQFMGMYD